jgi:hypothetical protein
LIDPPGVFAPVEEWLEFRDELLRSNIPHIQPHIDEANRAIDRLLKKPGADGPRGKP